MSAAALAAVVFIGPRLVPGTMLAGRVAEALTAATGAEVTVGQARLTLVGGPGLQVSNARLVRRGSYDVALERAELSLAVLPLAGRRVLTGAGFGSLSRCRFAMCSATLAASALSHSQNGQR